MGTVRVRGILWTVQDDGTYAVAKNGGDEWCVFGSKIMRPPEFRVNVWRWGGDGPDAWTDADGRAKWETLEAAMEAVSKAVVEPGIGAGI